MNRLLIVTLDTAEAPTLSALALVLLTLADAASLSVRLGAGQQRTFHPSSRRVTLARRPTKRKQVPDTVKAGTLARGDLCVPRKGSL